MGLVLNESCGHEPWPSPLKDGSWNRGFSAHESWAKINRKESHRLWIAWGYRTLCRRSPNCQVFRESLYFTIIDPFAARNEHEKWADTPWLPNMSFIRWTRRDFFIHKISLTKPEQNSVLFQFHEWNFIHENVSCLVHHFHSLFQITTIFISFMNEIICTKTSRLVHCTFTYRHFLRVHVYIMICMWNALFHKDWISWLPTNFLYGKVWKERMYMKTIRIQWNRT